MLCQTTVRDIKSCVLPFLLAQFARDDLFTAAVQVRQSAAVGASPSPLPFGKPSDHWQTLAQRAVFVSLLGKLGHGC